MPMFLVSHKVKDYAAWRPHFDRDEARRQAVGITTRHVLAPVNEPNHIHIMFEVKDPSAMDKLMSDPQMPKVMEEAGVLGQPSVQVMNIL